MSWIDDLFSYIEAQTPPAFRHPLMRDLRPRGEIEIALAERVIRAHERMTEAEAVVAGLYAMATADQFTKTLAANGGIDPMIVAYSRQRAEIDPANRAVLAAERAFGAAMAAFRREQDRRTKRKR